MKKVLLLILRHLLIAAGIAAFTAFMWLIEYKCYFPLLFGIPCPFCGMTRASLALFTLDFAGMAHLNPATPFMLLLLTAVFHHELLKKRFKVPLYILYAVCAAAVLGFYILRLACPSVPWTY